MLNQLNKQLIHNPLSLYQNDFRYVQLLKYSLQQQLPCLCQKIHLQYYFHQSLHQQESLLFLLSYLSLSQLYLLVLALISPIIQYSPEDCFERINNDKYNVDKDVDACDSHVNPAHIIDEISWGLSLKEDTERMSAKKDTKLVEELNEIFFLTR